MNESASSVSDDAAFSGGCIVQPGVRPEIFLSICIPTYARREKLNALLESIASQDLSEVEICISENGSDDGTSELVERWKAKLPIVYHYWPKNVGYDLNLLKVVELARGEYCWLLGSDDLIARGGIPRLIDRLKQSSPPGMLVGYRTFQSDPAPPVGLPVAREAIEPHTKENLMKIAPLFGFLSAQIFRRSLWQEALVDGRWKPRIGKAYLHLYMALKMAVRAGQWLYDPAPYVLYRTTSVDDQVQAFGSMHRRLLHEVTETSCIVSEVCSVQDAKTLTVAGVRRDLLRNLAVWRVSGIERGQRQEMEAALRTIPSPGLFYNLLICAIMRCPGKIVLAAHQLARLIRRTLTLGRA